MTLRVIASAVIGGGFDLTQGDQVDASQLGPYADLLVELAGFEVEASEPDSNVIFIGRQQSVELF